MLALVGAASGPGARGGGGSGAPAERGRVLSAVGDPPLPAEHWVLEDSSKAARGCSAGRRGAAEKECLAAVRVAASTNGLVVAGFKSVNDGAAGFVPAGCSFSLHTKTAMFNANADGGHRVGVGSYRLACLASPDGVPSNAAPTPASNVNGVLGNGARNGGRLDAPTEPPPKPNIVYVLADDAGSMGYKPWNPESLLDTPRINALAQAGITFTASYSDSSVCAPSRYAALSGNHAFRGTKPEGVWDLDDPSAFKPGQQTLADMLQASGYATYFVGKWHLGGGKEPRSPTGGVGGGPLMHGFNQSRVLWTGIQHEKFLAFADDDDDSVPVLTPCGGGVPMNDSKQSRQVWRSNAGPCLASWAVEKLREAPQPFFMYYSSQAAHSPHLPPAHFLDQGPVNGASGLGNVGDMMIEVDRAVGSLVDVLEERGVLSSTLVLMTGDNGQGCSWCLFNDEGCDRWACPSCTPSGKDPGQAATRSQEEVARRSKEEGHRRVKAQRNHGACPQYVRDDGATYDMLGGLRGFKGTPYEGGLRVPLVVSWPSGGVPQGAWRSQVVSQVDLVRTLVTLAGGSVPEGQAMDSLDFSSLLVGSGENRPADASQRTVSWHHSTIEGKHPRVVYILRAGLWKGVFFITTKCVLDGDHRDGAAEWTVEDCFDMNDGRADEHAVSSVELYHLGSDPQERKDLWLETRQQPGVRSDIRTLVSGFLSRNAGGLSTNDLARGDSPAARRLLACTQLPCKELYGTMRV